ncbi:uncharacterized protein LOC142230907 [Haematobia irritans]|uniref:uncharacterized protein LOC142230907 n=1 Tax=Haematobia irritans TaxID=7368 RepID=UPI003F4F9A16
MLAVIGNRIRFICVFCKRKAGNLANTKLNGKNLIKAINTYAVTLLTYTFGILSWSNAELKAIDRTIRTTLTINKHYHPKSAIERINIPRKLGGKGILNVQNLHDRQIQTLVKYFHTKANTSTLYRTIINSDDNLTPLNLKNRTANNPIPVQGLIQAWKSKPLHGRYPNLIFQSHVDLENTTNWLKYSNIYAETEGFIMAIQDGVIKTKNYRKYILHDNDKCRRCGGASETLPHLLNSCTALTHSHYTNRHNNMGKIIYINMIKSLNINTETTYYYKYHPKPIVENDDYIIYWDRSILVNNPPDMTIPNRPDMVIIDKRDKSMRIIDFAVPYDNNITETIITKKTKYQPLAEYIKNTQNVRKIEIIPIVISSLGTVPKETTTAIQNLNLKRNVLTEMQKSILIKATTILKLRMYNS